ncbi:MAG: hypothetical protein ACYTFI_18905 [Planctomycetota bacterium]|jgi:hypothetical protein
MIHLVVGLVTLCLGAWGIIVWWGHFGEALRGLIPLLLVLVGLAAIGAGFRKTIGGFGGENPEQPSPDTPGRPE